MRNQDDHHQIDPADLSDSLRLSRQQEREHLKVMAEAGLRRDYCDFKFTTYDHYQQNKHRIAWEYSYRDQCFLETRGRRIFRRPADQHWPCLFVGQRAADLDWQKAVKLACVYVSLHDRCSQFLNARLRLQRQYSDTPGFPVSTSVLETIRPDSPRSRWSVMEPIQTRTPNSQRLEVPHDPMPVRPNGPTRVRHRIRLKPGERITSKGIVLRLIIDNE
jgi:hypothetical protein